MIARVSFGDVDRLGLLVEQAKQRFPYVVFLPFLSGNPNRGGYDLFSPEGIRVYNPDRRFQAPAFQTAYGTAEYNEAAIIAALEAILTGGMPVGATASGPAQTTSSGGGSPGGGPSVVNDLFPDMGSAASAVGKYALPAAAIAALILVFKWRT